MVIVDHEKCDDCCTCISICPEDALIYKENLKVIKDKCILCGKCVKVCPFGALSIKKVKTNDA